LLVFPEANTSTSNEFVNFMILSHFIFNIDFILATKAFSNISSFFDTSSY